MRNLIFSVIFLFAGLLMFACHSGKSALTAASLNGEWNIVEVDGKSLSPNGEKGLPFIGFDAATHRVYGDAGCNRMMGSYAVDSVKNGELTLGPLGTTMMACPDMEQEKVVLDALNSVKSFNLLKDGKVVLKNAAGKEVITLTKK